MLKPPECDGCILNSFTTKAGQTLHLGRGFSRPEGKGTSGVVVIGEGLGHDEVVDGQPFRPHAQAGSKLEQCFRLAGVTREQFLLWNLIACQPPGNELAGAWYENQAISYCKVHFDRVVGKFQTPHQKTLLSLGNIPLKVLTGVSGVAEEKQSISYLRGYVFESRYGMVVPSYHPSFIKRNNHRYTPVLVADLMKAMDIASGKFTSYEGHPSFKQPDYNVMPSLDDAQSFYYQVRDNPRLPLAVDIETETSAAIEEDQREQRREIPIQIQFSLRKGEGIAFEWQEQYIDFAKLILALPNTKLGFNIWHFDQPILQAQDMKIAGHVHDLMWMFKQLHPEYDRHLQAVASLFGFPFPWKHLFSSRLGWYGCADVDALHWIAPKLIKLMRETNVWQGYTEQVYAVHPIMIGASERGMPVDKGAKESLTEQIESEWQGVEMELQGLVPDELKNVTPKRKVS